MRDEPPGDLREAVREAQEKMAKWVPKPIRCVSESCDKMMVEVSPLYYRCECGTALVKCLRAASVSRRGRSLLPGRANARPPPDISLVADPAPACP
jgi:hypothetical protein